LGTWHNLSHLQKIGQLVVVVVVAAAAVAVAVAVVVLVCSPESLCGIMIMELGEICQSFACERQKNLFYC